MTKLCEVLVLVVLLSVALSAGCSSSPDDGICEGPECACRSGSCNFDCDHSGCDISCNGADDCGGICDASCRIACTDTPSCNTHCADDCVSTCSGAVASCAIGCGDNCAADCGTSGECYVDMRTGDARCAEPTRCVVRCGRDGTVFPATDCGGGNWTCDSSCG